MVANFLDRVNKGKEVDLSENRTQILFLEALILILSATKELIKLDLRPIKDDMSPFDLVLD